MVMFAASVHGTVSDWRVWRDQYGKSGTQYLIGTRSDYLDDYLLLFRVCASILDLCCFSRNGEMTCHLSIVIHLSAGF